MPEGTVEGANTAPATTADALTPPVNDGFSRIDPSVDSVSDIDGPANEDKSNSADATKGAEAKAATDKAAADQAKADQEKADLERFDKHPRFQELNQKVKDLTAQLTDVTGKLTAKEQATAEATAKARDEKDLPFKDISKMSKEQVLEWQEDDPVGFQANVLQQIIYETREQIKAEETEKAQKASKEQATAAIKATFDKYEKENPDFRTSWDKGEIQKVMDEHPGIGAIGAHLLMTSQARIAEARAQAAKETEERVTKNFQAKRNAEVISDGGTVRSGDGIPDELKNTDKYGGRTLAMAQRLSRMRQAAAGG